MFLFYLLGVGLPCRSIFCQLWLCEEAQCVYLRRHLGSPAKQVLNLLFSGGVRENLRYSPLLPSQLDGTVCLPGDDVAFPGEFVQPFQLCTKDFTQVPLTTCIKYRKGPACICKGDAAGDSYMVSKVRGDKNPHVFQGSRAPQTPKLSRSRQKRKRPPPV